MYPFQRDRSLNLQSRVSMQRRPRRGVLVRRSQVINNAVAAGYLSSAPEYTSAKPNAVYAKGRLENRG
jgi:hypothetical protein